MFTKKIKPYSSKHREMLRRRKGWPFFAYDQWCCGKIIQKGTLKF